MQAEKEIVGQKVILHPIRISQAELMLEVLLKNTPKNLSHFEKTPTLASQEEWISKMISSEQDIVFAISVYRRIVGTIGLHEYDKVNHNARLGVLIFSPEDRKQGYGTEAIYWILIYAFTQLKLHKIYIRLLTDSVKKQSYFREKFKFEDEGELKGEYFLNGEYRDMFLLALLEPEWRKRMKDTPYCGCIGTGFYSCTNCEDKRRVSHPDGLESTSELEELIKEK